MPLFLLRLAFGAVYAVPPITHAFDAKFVPAFAVFVNRAKAL